MLDAIQAISMLLFVPNNKIYHLIPNISLVVPWRKLLKFGAKYLKFDRKFFLIYLNFGK